MHARLKNEFTEAEKNHNLMTWLISCLQGCATSPNDSERQQLLKSAAEELRSATNTAASNALKKKLIKRLEVRIRILWLLYFRN